LREFHARSGGNRRFRLRKTSLRSIGTSVAFDRTCRTAIDEPDAPMEKPSTMAVRLAVLASMFLAPAVASAAKATSRNFVVNARSQEIAQQCAEYAERYRREKALEWLGYELPAWPTPCTVDVKLTMGGAGGATSFDFDSGVVRQQHMSVEGPLHRILDSVLPHEVTHTVFAARFRRPLPRWADEGGSVISEDREERARHDLMVRQICRSGRLIPLRRLFVLTEYPRDVMALYAEGFSVSNYLVGLKGRRTFLDFVATGQSGGWDPAIQQYYGLAGVDALQERWVEWLIQGVGTGADEPVGPEAIAATKRRGGTPTVERVVRGQSPSELEWAPAIKPSNPIAERTLAASEPRRRSNSPADAGVAPARLPPGPPTPVVTIPPVSATRIPDVASADDQSSQGTLIPIAVGRARRTHSSSEQ
jgi:hypothetical protein